MDWNLKEKETLNKLQEKLQNQCDALQYLFFFFFFASVSYTEDYSFFLGSKFFVFCMRGIFPNIKGGGWEARHIFKIFPRMKIYGIFCINRVEKSVFFQKHQQKCEGCFLALL